MDAEFPLMTQITSRLCTKAHGLERTEEEGRWAALQPTSRQARPKFLPRNVQLVLLGWSCTSALGVRPTRSITVFMPGAP